MLNTQPNHSVSVRLRLPMISSFQSGLVRLLILDFQALPDLMAKQSQASRMCRILYWSVLSRTMFLWTLLLDPILWAKVPRQMRSPVAARLSSLWHQLIKLIGHPILTICGIRQKPVRLVFYPGTLKMCVCERQSCATCFLSPIRTRCR